MPILANIALIGWAPLVLVFFCVVKPHRALILAYVVGWLYLPLINFSVSGLPDFDKVMATTCGAALGVLIFDTERLFSYRFRWYDLPMIAWCISPLFSALTNGFGIYEGISAVERMIAAWGMPYLLGRLYLSSPATLRDLAIGLVIGGLTYVPFCLYEVRFSPLVNRHVYGFDTTNWEGMRYNGFRPRVFLQHGLECGMWLTLVTMIAYQCWARGVIKSLGGWPFWIVVVILGLTALLCKATGALFLLIGGLGILWLARVARIAWPVWILILLPAVYIQARTTGSWSGRQLTDLTERYLGHDRAGSVQYRFDNEKILAEKASQRWLFGWGGYGRSRVYNAEGHDVSVTDGLWIIVYGEKGMFGMVAMLSFLGLPIATMLRRNPVTSWSDPEVAPAAAMAIILGLFSLDSLSNAMPSPVYPLIAGGVAGLPAILPGRKGSPVSLRREAGDQLAAEGRVYEAIEAYHKAIAAAPMLVNDADSYRELAGVHDRLADILEASRFVEEADGERRAALELREFLADAADAMVEDHRGLAGALEGLAYNLTAQGRDAEAARLRRQAVAVRAKLASWSREDHDRWVLGLNDLAWLLATGNDASALDPGQAVRMAERATLESPSMGSFWNTLGVARYRSGDHRKAVEALERSIKLGPPGGTAFDLLFLAMARLRLGDESGAREAFDRGVAWADRHRPDHPGLARFRGEARAILAESFDQRPTVERA